MEEYSLEQIKLIHGILKRELSDLLKFIDVILRKDSMIESSYPLMDVFVSKNSISVLIDLPGVGVDDFTVYLFKNNLIIEGIKSELKNNERVIFHRMERDFFPFTRAVHLPANIDDDNIKASLKDGVLEIIIKRKRED